MTGLHCFVLVILASSRSNGLRLRTRCFDISCLSRGGGCVAVPGSQTMIAGIFRMRPQDCDCEPMLYARSRIVNAAAAAGIAVFDEHSPVFPVRSRLFHYQSSRHTRKA